jgi:general secretion pathway protein N
MHGRARLLVVGLVTFVAALVIVFPARLAYHWFAPPALALSGLRGSVWNGSAAEGMISGVYVRALSWRLRPPALLTGKIGYTVAASPASGFIDMKVGLGLTGTITISDLQGSLPLQTLEQTVHIPGLRGAINLQFDRLQFRDGLPVAAAGTVEVKDLVAPAVDRASIGGYRAEFFTQDSGVVASVEDTDGVVDIAGSLQISKNRNYQFVAQIGPKARTPANVRQQLKFLGSPNDRGQHELRLEGKL